MTGRFSLLCAAALALAVASCGGTSERSASSGGSAGAVADPGVTLPRLSVTDLAGGRADLRTASAPGKPLLVWFWAPH